MTDSPCILAIDQGTTSSRAIVVDGNGQVLTSAQQEFRQYYPADGWVEHDVEEIWQTTLAVCREALAAASDIAAIGITNQRETTVLWDRVTGEPVHKAIVWQDRRTAALCAQLRDAGHESAVTAKTGLLLDPYFSATKLAWLLDNVEGLRERAERGELAFGTIDSFLLWRLTGGRSHATDATNASRTMLFNIHSQAWDDELLELLRIPRSLMPEVRDSASDFGSTSPQLFGKAITIAGIAGDQQAALFGQACFQPGMIKSTYGTGCFAILNTGRQPVASKSRLLTTVGYRLNGEVTYAMEGSIFIAGAAIQWLRDVLGVIQSAKQTEELVTGLESNRGVFLVPAFTGLGAPYWDPQARGAVFGITRDTGPADLARAALESVCFQTYDLFDAMAKDGTKNAVTLRVDGGMAANNWLLQNLADTLNIQVQRPTIIETTALGAAYLAGLQVGVFDSLDDLSGKWTEDAVFQPRMDSETRQHLLQRWARAVHCAREFGN